MNDLKQQNFCLKICRVALWHLFRPWVRLRFGVNLYLLFISVHNAVWLYCGYVLSFFFIVEFIKANRQIMLNVKPWVFLPLPSSHRLPSGWSQVSVHKNIIQQYQHKVILWMSGTITLVFSTSRQTFYEQMFVCVCVF